MNFVVCCDDNWTKQVSVTFYSLSIHSKEPNNYYFLMWEGCELPDHSFSFIKRFINENDCLIPVIIPYNKTLSEMVRGRWSDIIVLRLLAPYYLPHSVDKYIYVDGDIVFNKNINDIYGLLNNSSMVIAGVTENHPVEKRITKVFSSLKDGLYFNSGFYLLNVNNFLKLYNSMDVFIKAIRNIKQEMLYFDQDVLNVLLDAHKVKISNDNYMHFPCESWSHLKGHHLIHYTTSPKPWDLDYKSVRYAARYWKYAKKVYGLRHTLFYMNKVIGNRIKYIFTKIFKSS